MGFSVLVDTVKCPCLPVSWVPLGKVPEGSFQKPLGLTLSQASLRAFGEAVVLGNVVLELWDNVDGLILTGQTEN